MQKIYIIGAGGHTRSVLVLLKNADIPVAGIYDDSFDPANKELINGIELIGNIDNYDSSGKIVLSFGDNDKRMALYRRYASVVFESNIVHSSSVVDDTVKLGMSNFVFAQSAINANAKIGNNNIINTGTIIEHEVEIGSHNHVSVGAVICGRSNIGDNCFIGAGAVIIDKVTLCNGVTLGANSVVIKSIKEPGVYAGNPVRKIA